MGFLIIFSLITYLMKFFFICLLQVDAALIATGRAPFTNGLGLENVDSIKNNCSRNFAIIISKQVSINVIDSM